jgi:exopolyphosphatase / guanosine-5'-triphosphate,3'-diphosphate pyrophosphatase
VRVAAIDIGTNTALLTIADVDGGRAVAIEEQSEICRLGEGLDKSGRLATAAIERTVAVLREYGEKIERHGCDRVVAVATEAVRKAVNQDLFVQEADAILGRFAARLEVIDGEREARLSWRAVSESFPQLAGARTVLDIGGGSTELLVGVDEVEEVVSLPIGSVRLTERLIENDPPTQEERKRVVAAVDEALSAAPAPRGALVGIAGTVTTLAAMAQALKVYDGAKVHGTRLSREKVEELAERLGRTAVAERRKMAGLEPKRADVIYAGAVILARVMDRARVGDCLVSDRGIRWGLVWEVARG